MKNLFMKSPYLLQQIYSAFFNIWIFIVTFATFDYLSPDIISVIFYGIPKFIILGIMGFSALWSVICIFLKKRFFKRFSIMLSIMVYLWIAFSAFRFSPFSLTAGTYFILATRYVITYLKVQED